MTSDVWGAVVRLNLFAGLAVIAVVALRSAVVGLFGARIRYERGGSGAPAKSRPAKVVDSEPANAAEHGVVQLAGGLLMNTTVVQPTGGRPF